jgi:putative ABC transport system substrate-binding protein
MKRREFIALIGVAAIACPLVARAQEQPSVGVRRIGVLWILPLGHPLTQRQLAAFTQALEHLGWTEGRKIRIDYRWYGGDADRARALARELVNFAPDAVVVSGTPALAAIRQETQSIPTVFVSVTDPVGQGFVASLAHPGGNITGFINYDPTMGSKWLELLKEIAPGLARVAVIFNPTTAPLTTSLLQSIEAVARNFAVTTTAAPIHDVTEIERAISAAASKPNGGLIVAPDAFNTSHHELITALAAEHQLPAVYPFASFAASGGLLCYAVDFEEQLQQAAVYIDRIFKGAQPISLPVQAPTKFRLLVNLKTAKALGLTIPPSIMVQADEVIE